jgi:hypothetical protein
VIALLYAIADIENIKKTKQETCKELEKNIAEKWK